MVRWSLESFINSTLARGEISRADVNSLRRDVLPDGIESRDETDVLIALDRAIYDKDGDWAPFLIQAVVDFVVWSSRPTGRVERDAAEWLVSSLSCGSGPTRNAIAIAFEVIREAESSDEALVAFVMRWRAREGAVLAHGRAPELVF